MNNVVIYIIAYIIIVNILLWLIIRFQKNSPLDGDGFGEKIAFVLFVPFIIPFILLSLPFEKKTIAQRMSKLKKNELKGKDSHSFEPTPEQVIYIEKDYNTKINKYIQAHYDDIRKTFGKEGLNFIYLPYYSREHSKQLLKYHFPWMDDNVVPDACIEISTADFCRELFPIDVLRNLAPSLIRFEKKEDEELIFKAVKFDQKQLDVAAGYFHFSDNTPDDRFYCKVNFYDEDMFSGLRGLDEFLEIERRLNMLVNSGVDTILLKNALTHIIDNSRPLSRIKITKEFKIFLTDYNNIEIPLSPINKALYLLFLNHPEGIVLKQLIDHKDELQSLYTKISHYAKAKRTTTIDSLVDPLDNSVHEKLSRIRNTFKAAISEDLAQHYYISGQKGEEWSIPLNRSFVDSENL